MKEQTAFPLSWPDGRPKTPWNERKVNRNFKATFANSRDACLREIKRLGGSDPIISTNVRLKRDGNPEAIEFGKVIKGDNGAAVYFKRNGKALCFACDRWVHVQDNLRAIALTISALRGISRWGTGDMMEAAFRGYLALPAPGESGGSDWHRTLGVSINATSEQVRAAYHILVLKHHPDKGGDVENFHRIKWAWSCFQTQTKGAG